MTLTPDPHKHPIVVEDSNGQETISLTLFALQKFLQLRQLAVLVLSRQGLDQHRLRRLVQHVDLQRLPGDLFRLGVSGNWIPCS